MIQRTDISGPSAPQIINLTCHSQDAIYLQWKRPTTFYNSIDFYVINYKESSYSNFQQIQLNTTASFAETAVCGSNVCFYSPFHLISPDSPIEISTKVHLNANIYKEDFQPKYPESCAKTFNIWNAFRTLLAFSHSRQSLNENKQRMLSWLKITVILLPTSHFSLLTAYQPIHQKQRECGSRCDGKKVHWWYFLLIFS